MKFFDKLSLNDLIISLIISITIFFIYMFFTTKVTEAFPRDFNTFLTTSSLSILIGYQFVCIKYLFSNIKPTFVKLKPVFKDAQFQTFFDNLDKKLQNFKMCYFVILLIIIPFILLEIARFWSWKTSLGPTPTYFSLYEPSNPWAIVLDIINHIFEYSGLFLLAIIVWIVISLILVINELESNPSINIDIFHIDDKDGLRPLQNFIVIVVGNYFIILTLAIISYITTTEIIVYQTILLISMLLLGVILFIITIKTIRNLINKGLKFELSRINEEYKKAYNKLINIISDNKFNKDELEKLLFILDMLEKEEIRIKQKTHKRFDIKAIATFSSSFLIPIVTLIITLFEKIFHSLPK